MALWGPLPGAPEDPEPQGFFHQMQKPNDLLSKVLSLVVMISCSGSPRAREGVPEAAYICCDQSPLPNKQPP